MANRSNFYKNPSYTYNKHLNLNSALQNLATYNIATGNAPPAYMPVPVGDEVIHRKRRRERKPPALHDNEIEETGCSMSHEEYISKIRKEVNSAQPYEELTVDVLRTSTFSSVSHLVNYDSDTSSADETGKKQDPASNPVMLLESPPQNKSPSASGNRTEVDRVKSQSEQRLPLPGEPVCVVCGKYGEYICNETDDDICSIDCKDEVLKNIQPQERNASIRNVVDFFSQKTGLEVPESGQDIWDYDHNCWSKKLSSLSTYKCWKCQRPGHLAEDCLVITSQSTSLSSGKTCNQYQVASFQKKPYSTPRDLHELYKRCHHIGKSFLTARCSVCRGSTTLATCLKCCNAFCDSVGHLSEHIWANPNHQQFYSFKLKRLVKCCKPTCQVTEIKDLLACHYCFNKAFDKFYDMYSATWKPAGFSIIWGSICCEDHFEWHRVNCTIANVEDSAYIVKNHGQDRILKPVQLSDFIF